MAQAAEVAPTPAESLRPRWLLTGADQRQRLDLSGPWTYSKDLYRTGLTDINGWVAKSRMQRYRDVDVAAAEARGGTGFFEFDLDRGPVMQLPGAWNAAQPELRYYDGLIWFQRKFTPPPASANQRAFLRFGAANYRAHVYLNGREVGQHEGGFTPFVFEVYKGELAVYSESVSVSSGGTTTLNTRTINNDPSQQSVLWRVGDWDGTPLEFLNGQTFNVRHPSDARNAAWGPVTYAVGSATNKFPAAIWKDQNNGTAITFTLSAAQVAARTLRIGISAAFANGRPQVTVNNNWTSGVPSPSTQPDSRSLTIGTYRGNNTTFTYSIPASALVAGSNTLTINVASGSGSAGFLSAGVGVDCIDLY